MRTSYKISKTAQKMINELAEVARRPKGQVLSLLTLTAQARDWHPSRDDIEGVEKDPVVFSTPHYATRWLTRQRDDYRVHPGDTIYQLLVTAKKERWAYPLFLVEGEDND